MTNTENISRYHKNRMIQESSNGNLKGFLEITKNIKDNISPELYDRICYYAARNGHAHFCEHIISNYRPTEHIFDKFGNIFDSRDSCKGIYQFINNINEDSTPILFKYTDSIIREYLHMSHQKGYVKNFGHTILMLSTEGLRNSTFQLFLEKVKDEDTTMKKKFFLELSIVNRDNILEDLLNED